MITVLCKHCGKEITGVRPSALKTRKYCSRKCQNKAAITNIKKPCEICGKPMLVTPSMVKRNKHHYCSNACRGISLRAKPNKPCAVCGKLFVATKSREESGRDKYCSRECYYASEGKPSVTQTCLMCNKEFLAEYNQVAINKGKFCSKACVGKWMSENKRGDSHPRWNSQKTDKERIHERRIEGYKEWRSAVYERDGYICQHCGKGAGQLQAHHIIPFSTDKSLRLEITNGITLCDLFF